MNERQQVLQTLEATHEFPCAYTFKLIGDNETRLLEDALTLLKEALPREEPVVSRRESDKGNHQSITFVVRVPDAETVHDLYVSFRGLSGLRVLL